MLVSLSIIHFAYYFLNYVNGLLIIQLLTSNHELIQYKIELSPELRTFFYVGERMYHLNVIFSTHRIDSRPGLLDL